MELRITNQVRLDRNSFYMRQQSDELARLQQQVATGIRLHKPSDNPLDLADLAVNKAQDLRLSTYQANVRDARETLNRGVSNLLEASNVFTRARQIALEGANGTTQSQSFEALAQETDDLINRLLTVANSRADGRVLFGGTGVDRIPFEVTSQDPQGRPLTVEYRGAQENATALIGPDQPLDTVYNGSSVFQAPGRDAFQALIGLRDELRNVAQMSGPAQSQALSQRVQVLEQAQQSILGKVGSMSVSLENLEALDQRISDLQVDTRGRIGELESTDYADAVLRLTEQENLFTTTLASAARIFDQSLLDFLR